MARTKRKSLRSERTGFSPVKVGIVAAIVVLIGTYFAFTKAVPFTHGFRLNAVFQSANSIRPGSPVRIAGVNVGKVTGVERQPGTNAAIVKMELDKTGLPIHKDAELKIRPRIFLEGNFFVDLKPGTPSAPTLSDGDTVAITQTATPVQLDEVLTALQQPTRESLQVLLQNFGGALSDEPTPAENAAQDPINHGKTAAQALNQTLDFAPSAEKNGSIVNQAFLGAEPHDLTNLIASLGSVAGALDKSEGTLEDFIGNFNTTLAAFASQSTNLSQSINLLAPTVVNADKALTSLNNSFPATRLFALEIIPGVEQTQPTIDAATPWIAQAKQLISPPELGHLLKHLQPTIADLASVSASGTQGFQQSNLTSKCSTKVLLPTGDIKISDGAFSTNEENYKEFMYSLVGFAGEGQNFDGNGQYIRAQTGGGQYLEHTLAYPGTGLPVNLGRRLYGYASFPSLGTRPPKPKQTPPVVSSQPCYKQAIPNLNATPVGPREGGGAGVLPTTFGPTRRAVTPLAAVVRAARTVKGTVR
jgi:virulence factor Mce-like protein